MKTRLLSICALLFLFSCEKETPSFELSELRGYWEIFEAKRNGNFTNTLQGAWIKIKDDQMMDNFFTKKVKYPISLQGNELIHHAKEDKKYIIKSVTSDTLVLETKYRKYKFEFKLKKIRD